MFEDCTCPNLGNNYSEWAGRYLGLCMYSFRDYLSLIFGLLAVVLMIFSVFPRYKAIFTTSAVHKLSGKTLFMWFMIDIVGLLGLFFSSLHTGPLFWLLMFYALNDIFGGTIFLFAKVMRIFPQNKRDLEGSEYHKLEDGLSSLSPDESESLLAITRIHSDTLDKNEIAYRVGRLNDNSSCDGDDDSHVDISGVLRANSDACSGNNRYKSPELFLTSNVTQVPEKSLQKMKKSVRFSEDPLIDTSMGDDIPLISLKTFQNDNNNQKITPITAVDPQTGYEYEESTEFDDYGDENDNIDDISQIPHSNPHPHSMYDAANTLQNSDFFPEISLNYDESAFDDFDQQLQSQEYIRRLTKDLTAPHIPKEALYAMVKEKAALHKKNCMNMPILDQNSGTTQKIPMQKQTELEASQKQGKLTGSSSSPNLFLGPSGIAIVISVIIALFIDPAQALIPHNSYISSKNNIPFLSLSDSTAPSFFSIILMSTAPGRFCTGDYSHFNATIRTVGLIFTYICASARMLSIVPRILVQKRQKSSRNVSLPWLLMNTAVIVCCISSLLLPTLSPVTNLIPYNDDGSKSQHTSELSMVLRYILNREVIWFFTFITMFFLQCTLIWQLFWYGNGKNILPRRRFRYALSFADVIFFNLRFKSTLYLKNDEVYQESQATGFEEVHFDGLNRVRARTTRMNRAASFASGNSADNVDIGLDENVDYFSIQRPQKNEKNLQKSTRFPSIIEESIISVIGNLNHPLFAQTVDEDTGIIHPSNCDIVSYSVGGDGDDQYDLGEYDPSLLAELSCDSQDELP